MRIKIARIKSVVVVLLVLAAQSALAAKTDVVTLRNGDTVTGEIQSLEFGALSYKTDSMGTVSIDWEDVVKIKSDQNLQVELFDGTRYFGTLEKAEADASVRVITSSDAAVFSNDKVVRMTPIETAVSFWEKLDGSFSLGFQTQKSSGVSTSNLAADINFRARKYLVGLRLSSTITDQPSEDTSRRQSLNLNYQRFRGNRWFSDWFVGWERNDELGILARTSLGGAYGRYLIQTNINQFSIAVGAQAARETYIGSEPTDTAPEGRIEFRYLHRKISPEAYLNLTSTIYPQLSDLSQFRAETDLTWSRDLLDDFSLDLSVGHSYDSDPPPDAAGSDYAITTSLSYKF